MNSVHAGIVIAGSAAALLLLRAAFKARSARQRKRWQAEQLRGWTEIARSLGFRAEARDGEAVLVGEAASRPFELAGGNFVRYGMDVENCLRVRVEDEEATLSVALRESPGNEHDGPRLATGDAGFDARARVRANERGLRYFARLGPDERRILLERPQLEVLLSEGSGWIRLPYRLTTADVQAAVNLAAALWPAASAAAEAPAPSRAPGSTSAAPDDTL